jgi:hypothetical protein
MQHTIFFHDNRGDFQSSMLFSCDSKDICVVVEKFEKEFPHRKVVSVTMFDGMQWAKRPFVGWETF